MTKTEKVVEMLNEYLESNWFYLLLIAAAVVIVSRIISNMPLPQLWYGGPR